MSVEKKKKLKKISIGQKTVYAIIALALAIFVFVVINY